MRSIKEQEKRSAILYQSLYLMNLLLIPGIAFFILIWQYFKNNEHVGWPRSHLFRSLQLGFLSGISLVIIPLCAIFFTSRSDTVIAMTLVYFVTAHASFVLIGMFNLSRAMSKKPPLF